MMTPRLSNYFKDYSQYHRTEGNKFCHFLGIPLITISLLGLFSYLILGGSGLMGSDYIRIDGGTILIGIAGLWYLALDWRIAIPFTLFNFGLYFLGRTIPMGALWGIFVLGWVFQGVGHYHFEKRSPAFFKNFEHLLIGPLWIFAKLIKY